MKYIKYIYILFIVNLFTCAQYEKKETEYIPLFADSINFYYKQLSNGLRKVIRFFPNTKDTSKIYFINKNNKKDSILLNYDRTGNLLYKINYKNNAQIKICTEYFKNGNIKKEYTIINNYLQGEEKKYFNTGELMSIREIILYNDSLNYINNIRTYNKSGELNRDSTFFIEMILKKDTISINDSLKIEFNVLIPEYSEARAYFGSIEKYIVNNVNYNNVKFIENKICYYKPKHIGINWIEIVFEINTKPNKKPIFYKKFLKKEIFVTE